jgi:hypothetical protein
MQIDLTGNITMRNPRREAGTYQMAYAVTTPSGKTGIALWHYEWDKRDVMDERLSTTPEIADEMRAWLDDDSPSCFGAFCYPSEGEENKNAEAVTEAHEKATVLVYGWE